MAKPIALSYVNRADAATLTGGAWTAGLPLANLIDPLMAAVARSSNALAASTQFQIDLGAASTRSLRLLALVRHNLSNVATYRVTVGSTPGGTDLYDSGATAVWPALYLPGDLEWEDDNWWTGTPSADDVAGYPMGIWHDTGANINGRYWSLAITDTANPAGYVQASRVWLGELWSPVRSYEYGAGLTWEARDVEEQSLGGVNYYDGRPNARVMTFAFGSLTYQETYGVVLEIQRIAKNSGQVVIIPDSEDAQYFFKRNLLARLRKMDPLKQIGHSIQSAAFEAEEVL